MKHQSKFLLQTTRQMNVGAMVTGALFLLYLAVSAMGRLAAADLIALVSCVPALYVLASVADGRRRDKEAVSYSLLWGQTALTLLIGACAVLPYLSA